MRTKYRFKIKNYKLAILALLFIAFFTYLGCWQLSRAHYKQALLDSYAERTKQTPLAAHDLTTIQDWRFYRVQLTGYFDNEHTFLLDNKTFERRVGYEVYTPMHVKGFETAILIDRGFVPLGSSRNDLPTIAPIRGEVSLTAMFNLPPLYVSLGKIVEQNNFKWPLRVEYINQAELSNILNYKLFPYIALMQPTDARAYPLTWQVVIMPPERHLGYAVQWFALALTLLILFVALNRVR